MTGYIVRRLLLVPLLLLGVTVLIFGMLQFLSPVERSALYVRDVPHTEAALDGIIKRYGLDDPPHIQYWHWLVGRKDSVSGERVGGILRGDLGYSRVGSQPVADLIRQRFPATLELALWSVGPIIVVGVWLGILAAVHHNGWFDQLARVFSIVGWSFPVFVFGLMVLMLFYAKLGWFPPGRMSDWAAGVVFSEGFTRFTGLLTIDGLLNGRLDVSLDVLRHLVLPVITLSYLNWALLLRVTRSSMLETLGQEYVVTARAKGLRESVVVNRHARPNALIPVATLAGFTVIQLLNGVVITETVFNYPGIGSAAATAASQLDVVTVLGFALFNGAILVVTNLGVDVMYAVIDPRVRLA
jgi:peptide/nickel transport system permease protein